MAFLLLLALVVTCVAGFFLIRVLRPDSPSIALPSFITPTPAASFSDLATEPPPSPTIPSDPGNAQVAITPERGYINTLITVIGEGWWAGEPVFIFLRSQEEEDGRGYAYAAAVADDDGGVRTALTFPNEMRWIGQSWADVIARGTRSGFEASTRFTLVAPTPTNTLPPPTPSPTLAPTNTPQPTDPPLPTETPSPTFTPTPELILTDWQGEYFANPTVTGDPVFVRNDPFIDFNWGVGSPGAGIPADSFSARWTRFLEFGEGSYRFYIQADDGVRFWIDGQLHVDEWHDGLLEPYSFDVDLYEGSHALQLEFYENLGGAMVQLTWDRIEPTPVPSDVWRGQYYDNKTLSGQPVLVRDDADLNFDWGRGSPGPGVPANYFSVRWTLESWTAAGTYRVYLEADEGVRYWVDGELLINEWHKTTGETYMVEITVSEGVHKLKVQYYDGIGDAHIHLWGERVP